MRLISRFLLTLSLSAFLFSCQKMVTENLDDDTPIPPIIAETNCLLTKLQYSDTTGETYNIDYFYEANGNRKNCIEKFYDGSTFDWSMKFGQNRVDLTYNQWIEFDDSGRVGKSRMLFIPYDNDRYSTAYIETYTYNSDGYLTTVVYERDPNPLVTYGDSIGTVTTNTWSDGNMIKTRSVDLDGSKTEIDFVYDPARISRSAELLGDQYVLLLFPGFFNTGKGNKNVLKSYTYKTTESDGTVSNQGKVEYSDFKFDSKGNIVSCKATSSEDGNIDTYVETRSYKCL